MLRLIVAFALSLSLTFAAAPVAAAGPKNCEELRSEIAAKLDAKSVQHYQLTVLEASAVQEHQIVGSCAGGSMRITYQRQIPGLDVSSSVARDESVQPVR